MYRFEIILTIIFILILSKRIMMNIKDKYFSSSDCFDYLKDLAFCYAFFLDKLGIES